MKYELEPFPENLDSCDSQILKYINVRNAMRRVLNAGAPASEGVLEWIRALPVNERRELAALLE